MKNKEFENSISFFESLEEITRNYQYMFQSITDGLIEFQKALKSISEVMNAFHENIKIVGSIFTSELYKFGRIFAAIKKLEDNQFVYWDYLSQDFVDELLETKDVNEVLKKKIIENNCNYVNKTIKKCLSDLLMKKYEQLFKQAIDCYRKKYYDISINGLTSIIDGLLSDISRNTSHSMSPRINAVISKLKTNDILDYEENALLILVLTFEKTLISFCEFAPFDKEEPIGLNRHWIAHGRSSRKKTELDCVKLINLIYGMLLINQINNDEEVKDE